MYDRNDYRIITIFQKGNKMKQSIIMVMIAVAAFNSVFAAEPVLQ